MTDARRSFAALGFGLAYSLAAVALLLQALDVMEVRWGVVVPLILIVCGLVVLVSGVHGARTGSSRSAG
jgi:hypothetical protein